MEVQGKRGMQISEKKVPERAKARGKIFPTKSNQTPKARASLRFNNSPPSTSPEYTIGYLEQFRARLREILREGEAKKSLMRYIVNSFRSDASEIMSPVLANPAQSYAGAGG